MPIDRLSPLRLSVVCSLLLLTSASFLLAGPPPCQTNADCNDNNVCTADVCLLGTGECRHALNFVPHQCCDVTLGIVLGYCEVDNDGCTLSHCLRTFPQGSCTPIDIEQIPCATDGQCQAATAGVSPTCGQVNPGFCDCVCGNGALDGNEQCDDAGETATCDIDCTFVECGDGYVNAVAGETCDNLEPCFCGTCIENCTVAEVCSACPCNSDVDCKASNCNDDNACNHGICDPICHVCYFECAVYGDTNSSGGSPNLDDILCTIRAFSNFSDCPNADIQPCAGNGILTLDDILSVLGAFGGSNFCGCDENATPGSGVAPLCGSSNP